MFFPTTARGAVSTGCRGAKGGLRCSARPSPSATASSARGRGRISSVYLARHVLIDLFERDQAAAPQPRAGSRIHASCARRARSTASTTTTSSRSPTTARPNGLVYLVMEYVPGETMKALRRGSRRGRAPPHRHPVAAALGRAHQMGRHSPRREPQQHLLGQKAKTETRRSSSSILARKIMRIPKAPLGDGAPLPRTGYTQPPKPCKPVAAMRYRIRNGQRAALDQAISGVSPSGATSHGCPVDGSSPALHLDERAPDRRKSSHAVAT